MDKFFSSSLAEVVPTTMTVSEVTMFFSTECPWYTFAKMPEKPIAMESVHSPPDPTVETSIIPSPPSTDNFAAAFTFKYTFGVPSFTTVPTSVRIELPLGRSVTAAAFVVSGLLVVRFVL